MMEDIFCALVIMIGIAALVGLAAVLEKFNVIIDLLEILLGLEEPKE